MRLLLAVLVAGAVAGCIPAPYGPYYRPAYPDASATLTKQYCAGKAGPPSILGFAGPEGLSFEVRAFKEYAERDRRDWPLRIALTLPAGAQFRFVSDELEISESSADRGRTVTGVIRVDASRELAADAWVDLDATGPIQVDAARDFAAADPQHVVAEVRLPLAEFRAFSPQRVSMTMPAIEVGRERISFAPIQLAAEDYRPGSLVYRTAQYRKSLEERHARCLTETPARECANILRHDPYGVRDEHDGFRLSGRIWVWDTAAGTPFSATLGLETRRTERWRFSVPEVRFRDPATGQDRVHRFESMQLSMRYRVPLSTPVRAVSRGATAATALRIEAGLGEERASGYFIRLPPFLLNGRQYELKPIELELRLLDGGIEPFNC